MLSSLCLHNINKLYNNFDALSKKTSHQQCRILMGRSISNGGKPPYPLATGEMNSPYATLRAPRLNVAFEQRQRGTVTLFNITNVDMYIYYGPTYFSARSAIISSAPEARQSAINASQTLSNSPALALTAFEPPSSAFFVRSSV